MSPEMMDELGGALERVDHESEVRAIVVAGSDDVFAAGADIRALRDRTFGEALFHPTSVFWKRLAG
ncbi:MAG: enoyl-CoA hydratase-related protein, partial [Mycobacterium sp.]